MNRRKKSAASSCRRSVTFQSSGTKRKMKNNAKWIGALNFCIYIFHSDNITRAQWGLSEAIRMRERVRVIISVSLSCFSASEGKEKKSENESKIIMSSILQRYYCLFARNVRERTSWVGSWRVIMSCSIKNISTLLTSKCRSTRAEHHVLLFSSRAFDMAPPGCKLLVPTRWGSVAQLSPD